MASPRNNGNARGFRYTEFPEVDPQIQRLLREAQQKLDSPYNPNSGFSVAAAVLTSDGQIVVGTNIENAAYGSSICAERTALSTAHNLGVGDQCVAIAIVARGKEGHPTPGVTAPCGECRQVISEYGWRSGVGEGFRVYLATTDLQRVLPTTIGILLPLAFGPEDLLNVEPQEAAN
ncbi:MAG: cytidine deaminase [Parcubacteria group bacterium Greene0714_21]|nr:MAG: cytidine deaminase [Parcubacteria group bacterium Greene0416_39]TSC97330.1 MAG: cytidine deaminase [Parcubacteria group bacterium Greene1014_47]TSD03942.1 MAG: cytidine deaminase [Parcubacteria group bacterium Greene0714_21]